MQKFLNFDNVLTDYLTSRGRFSVKIIQYKKNILIKKNISYVN